MTREERRAKFVARQKAASAANNVARGLPASFDPYAKPTRKSRRKVRSPRPACGSQEWAETYRDDLGESQD